jgi:iron(III) transport system ATP-binding protein
MSGDQPALRVDRLVGLLGGRRVVDDVSLDVMPGELVTLVGPSGCGKSTLLRLVAGLERAETGAVVLDGCDVTHLPAERRRVGLVFQDHALYPHLRVAGNVAFGLRHLSRTERRRRVGELLELVRLPHAARRYPHELSGGEQQRVALARALAPEPQVVLLDEPFASLDASLRDELRAEVVSALRSRGATAVLVTHDRDEALATGDRVAVMGQGRLHHVGTADEVYERPVDRFVASFLGPAAFLPAGGGGVLMARPHDLGVTSGGAAEIVARTYLGAAWRYTVRQPDGSTVLVDVSTTQPLDVGAAVTVSVVADHPLHQLSS